MGFFIPFIYVYIFLYISFCVLVTKRFGEYIYVFNFKIEENETNFTP